MTFTLSQWLFGCRCGTVSRGRLRRQFHMISDFSSQALSLFDGLFDGTDHRKRLRKMVRSQSPFTRPLKAA